MHKPRGQLWGRGISEMTVILRKPYLVKVTKKLGEVVKNTQKFDYVVYGRLLEKMCFLVYLVTPIIHSTLLLATL